MAKELSTPKTWRLHTVDTGSIFLIRTIYNAGHTFNLQPLQVVSNFVLEEAMKIDPALHCSISIDTVSVMTVSYTHLTLPTTPYV